MTEAEYKNLTDQFTEPVAKEMIEILSNYKGSKGKNINQITGLSSHGWSMLTRKDKIVIMAAIKNINEIIQSLQPQIQQATKRIYRSPLSKEDSYRLLYYCYKAEVEREGLL